MSTAMGGNALAKPAEKETHKEKGEFFYFKLKNGLKTPENIYFPY